MTLNRLLAMRVYKANFSRTEKGKACMRRSQDRYRRRYPEKKRASRTLWRAVKTGKIIKPERCSKCGDLDKKLGSGSRTTIHGHHYNGYHNPLQVVWLCYRCHVQVHQERSTP
jgi:hypothetical protein